MFAARLRAYLPGGASLGELPLPISWEASVVHNDVGALQVTYSTLAAGGQHINREMEDGLEVAVEIWNGLGNWVEARGCRFVRVKQGVDQADQAKVFRITFVSWGWLLMKARLFDGTTSGRRLFATPKVGPMLTTLLNENQALGGIATQMSIVGGGSNDAAGAAWPTLPDQTFNYGQDYLATVRSLQEAGALDWTTQARGLYAYLPDSTTLSPDLSATVKLNLGIDIGEAPADSTIEDLISAIGVSADAGGNVVVDEPTAPAPHGKWQGHLAVGVVDDESAAIAMGEADLERSAKAKHQYTRALMFPAGHKIPMIDYWPGAWITAPTNVLAEKVRVQQITMSFGKEGYRANVVLNDRLLNAEIRRNRTLAALAGGQVGSGGAPPPVSVDPEASRVPVVPTSFATTTGLSFTGPTPRGVLTSTWNPVSTATDGGALVISGYEFQWRVAPGQWQTVFTTEPGLTIPNLDPGLTVESRVRAVGARTTFPSAYTSIDTDVIPGDVTAPPVPTGLTFTSARGQLRVDWAGTPTMPVDFDRLEIAIGSTTTPTTVVGSLRAPGTFLYQDTIGATRYMRARTVDSTGNASAWTTVAGPVVVASVVAGDIDSAITAAITAAGTTANTALVQSNMIILGGPNLLLNNDFSQPGSAQNAIVGWGIRTSALTVDPVNVTGPDGVTTTAIRLTPAAADQGLTNDAFKTLGNGTLVEHGKSFRFVIRARKVSGTSGNLRIRAGLWRSGVANSWPVVTDVLDAATAVAGQWVTLTGTLLMPDTHDKLSVSIHLSNASGSVFEVADAFMYGMADAELVVDGSIKTRSLAADAVTAAVVQAGSLTGDLFSALMTISSLFTTSADGTGQRVEFDTNGIRLFNAANDIRVNLPTDPTEDAYFRGEVQADGLTVTGGASFYSTQNEFAPDSLIALAASVSAPVAAPNVSTFWASTPLTSVVTAGSLGTFGLDMSLVQCAFWNPTTNIIQLVQKAPSGGSRVWYYGLSGLLSTFWDLPASWDVSSMDIGADGQFRIMFRANSKWWIYDYSRPDGSRQREYVPINASKRPFMIVEQGTNNIYVYENDANTIKYRRVTTDTDPVTVASSTITTGAPSTQTQEICAAYRGSADFGAVKNVVAHRTNFGYRHFSSAGAYESQWNFDSPTSKVGFFWRPDTGRFYTIGADGKIYTHSALIWTDSALDTWHLGQTFRDTVGTIHETTVGAFRSFAAKKRAWQRVQVATVPYAGGAEDPNAWRLYGKTGTAPSPTGTGTFLQASGAYTLTQVDFGTLLTATGSAPPTTSNFPQANPARMQSAARLPTDSTKAMIDLRGDGYARLGPLELSTLGVLTDTRDVGWTNSGITWDSNWVSDSAVSTAYNYVEYCRIAGIVYMRGLARIVASSSGASEATLPVLTLPVGFRPSKLLPLSGPLIDATVTSSGASTGTAHTHTERAGPVARIEVSSAGVLSVVRPLGHFLTGGSTKLSLAQITFPTL